MRTVKEPDVRKSEILDGAIVVFAKKGYDRTTISDIAKELKISQGLCYRYFSSKEAIYDAALEKYADLIAEENRRMADMSLSVKDIIDRVTASTDYRKAEKKDEGLYQLFHSKDSRRLHDELSILVAKKVLPIVSKRLRKAKEEGEIDIEDPEGAAVIGVYGWVGLFMTDGLSDKERLKKMRSAWYTLLNLN